MLIRNKIILVYDIEVFPNVFHAVVKNTETSHILKLEISERRNDINKILLLFHQIKHSIDWNQNYTTECNLGGKYIFCGFNNIHYDNPIINYIITNRDELIKLHHSDLCLKLKMLSNDIINSGEGIQAWHKWKYLVFFDTLDLQSMLYSQKLRVGLKEMQVTMLYRNVQEYEGDFDKPLPVSEIDNMIAYNINDVESTEALLYMCKSDIELRLAIEDEYGVKVLNKDGVNIGMKIITQKYLEKTGLKWNQIKDLRSPCDIIELNKVILPIIKFDDKVLQDTLIELKQLSVSPGRKGYKKQVIFGDIEWTIGVGGIHTVNKPEVFIPEEGWIISDIDVASLYPSMIIEHKFYPPHLGEEFLEVYSNIKAERIEAKHNGNKVKDSTLKLALNGLSGNLQNKHNFCYSPFTVMQIRMNGQLMLLMLAEKLTQIGCKILQANTDGLFILRRLSDEQKFKKVCKEWESLTKLVLEEDQFEAFYQYAVNDYLAIKKGYKETHDPKLLKKKGLFIDEVRLGKGMDAMIIPEAINKCLADGIDVSDTIINCKDLNKFITYQKVNKTFSIEYASKLIARINRYYVSVAGHTLLKCKVAEDGTRSNYISLISGYGVTVVNNFDEVKEFPRDINYSYYIQEASKITSAFKHQQLSLF